MSIKNAGLAAIADVWTAVPSGVCQLQADEQTIVGASNPTMFFDQRRPQLGKATLGVRSDYELVGIGTPIMRHGNRFAAPDKFGAARAEATPTPDGVLGWIAVGGAVPTLHW